MARSRVQGAALLLLSLVASGTAVEVGAAQEPRGWIGVEVQGTAFPDGAARVMIVRVDRDSPAERSGLRPDDILLRLDGVDVSLDVLRELMGRIRPGTPVQVTVLREQQERSMRMIAGTRPAPMGPAAMEVLAARVDSARGRFLQLVDSLLADSAWAAAHSEMEAARRALDEEGEAIREVMERTRERMRSMRFRRPREPTDAPTARGRASGDERRGPGERPRPRVTVGGRGFDERRGPGGPPPGSRFRSPYLLGERFVAGAELEEMDPDANVDDRADGRRLYVVQVVEGSPADRAGLAPEDVILSIGGEPVADLREFRIRLGRLILRGGPEMEVVRGDTTLVIILPRP